MAVSVGIPASILNLNQQGLLERAYHDGLYPNLAYRAEAAPEEWEVNTGETRTMTRAGLLPPIVTPQIPGTDPIPQQVPFEQWTATLSQFSGAVDTNLPTSTTTNANLFLRNLHQLGLQAGQSVNRLARNELFKAYVSGQTVTTTTIGAGDTQLRVASLNGFTDVVIPNSSLAPQPVSASFPLAAKVGAPGSQVAVTIVGFQADTPGDVYGSGTLFLSAAIGTAFATTRNPVVSAYAPTVVRTGIGNSIDGIGANDTLTLQHVFNSVALLRRQNVQPHDDGYFHCHISPVMMAQLFADPVFQRLNQSLPEHAIYKEGFLGWMAGVMFFMNNESPETATVNGGTLVATALSGVFASEIGAEVTNGSGVNIGRAIITGKGGIYEKYRDESAYVTEAGTTGKIGEFDVVNNSIQILTERIRLVIRSPMDRLQQNVSAAWSITTSFPIPSDITAPGGTQRFRRCIVIESATA